MAKVVYDVYAHLGGEEEVFLDEVRSLREARQIAESYTQGTGEPTEITWEDGESMEWYFKDLRTGSVTCSPPGP